MNRSINVVFNDPLRDNNRILKVITIPRHERYEHVPTESKLTRLCVWSIRENVTLLDLVTDFNNRLLVDAGSCIRTHELPERISVNVFFSVGPDFAGIGQELGIGARQFTVFRDDNHLSRSRSNFTTSFGNHNGT